MKRTKIVCSVFVVLHHLIATVASISEPSITKAPITSPTIHKFTADNVLNLASTTSSKDVLKRLTKRNNSNDSTSAASLKSYDPPPEFYRGPGTNINPSENTLNGLPSNVQLNGQPAGFSSKPVAFPDANSQNNLHLSQNYKNWPQSPNPSYTNAQGLNDRISVGHYTNTAVHHGQNTALNSYHTPQPSPYTTANHYEYGKHYAPSEHVGLGNDYYASAAPDGDVHFDVYNAKGHYSGAGGEYSYTYPEMYESPAHKSPHTSEISPKALLAKSFLIPLASAAVLGIAAALVSNPLLLQLGTVSAIHAPAIIGKRRRRSLRPPSNALEAFQRKYVHHYAFRSREISQPLRQINNDQHRSPRKEHF